MIDHKPTFCRICEPLCGIVATVEDGRLVALRPDRDHPLSAGFACHTEQHTGVAPEAVRALARDLAQTPRRSPECRG